MGIIKGNQENFDEVVSKGTVLVDFFAVWCGPCKMLAPELEKVSSKITVVKVDVDENLELSRRFGVMSVPTLVLFKDGKQVNMNIGYMPAEEIEKWVNA